MNPDSFFGSEVRILEFGLGLFVIVGIFGLVWVGVFCFVFLLATSAEYLGLVRLDAKVGLSEMMN